MQTCLSLQALAAGLRMPKVSLPVKSMICISSLALVHATKDLVELDCSVMTVMQSKAVKIISPQ